MTQEIGLREVFQQMDARLSAVESAVEGLRQEIQELRREQVTNFRWVSGILIGTLFPMWATYDAPHHVQDISQ